MTATDMAGESRRLRHGLISLAVFFALIAGLLLAVPGLRSAADRITDANPTWIALGVFFELLSCAGYVVLFELVFGMERRFSRRLSLAELAVNSVLSVGGIGGIALGAWVLRSRGVPIVKIAQRSVLLFLLTSAVSVAAVIVLGVCMWIGLVPGSRNPLLTLLPAALAAGATALTLGAAALADRLAERRSRHEGGVYVALVSIRDGVRCSLKLIAKHDWRLLGSVAYWLFDTMVLYACLAAFGPVPSFGPVAMAYLVGLLANSVPLPAGVIAVEGGLIGMLVLFKLHPVSVIVAAVVAYRAISLWVPALIGSVVFLGLRREIGQPVVAAGEAASSG